MTGRRRDGRDRRRPRRRTEGRAQTARPRHPARRGWTRISPVSAQVAHGAGRGSGRRGRDGDDLQSSATPVSLSPTRRTSWREERGLLDASSGDLRRTTSSVATCRRPHGRRRWRRRCGARPAALGRRRGLGAPGSDRGSRRAARAPRRSGSGRHGPERRERVVARLDLDLRQRLQQRGLAGVGWPTRAICAALASHLDRVAVMDASSARACPRCSPCSHFRRSA